MYPLTLPLSHLKGEREFKDKQKKPLPRSGGRGSQLLFIYQILYYMTVKD
jgi:hypothetical protein